MNCRKGDLAVIVHPENDGVLVHVDGPPRQACAGLAGWWGCTILSGMTAYKGQEPTRAEPGTQVDIADSVLRPLRDPGDARDQTLDWLPVPKMTDIEELGVAAEHLKALDRFIRERLT